MSFKFFAQGLDSVGERVLKYLRFFSHERENQILLREHWFLNRKSLDTNWVSISLILIESVI